MLYSYETIDIKPKLNKKKVILLILIVLTIIAVAVYAGIYFYKKNKENQIAKEQEEITRIKIEEENKIKEEQRKEQERLKNSVPFTEEQIEKIENIYHLPEGKNAFLTFDDGPTQSVTPLILDLLKQENIKATFFVLGNRAKANPELIKREFDEGHYIANHGYSHKYSAIYQNTQTVLDEYNYTESCIQEALENPDYHSRLFRFPGGSVGGYYHSIKKEAIETLKEQGIAYLDWNSLSKDAEGAKTKEDLFQNVVDTIGEKQNVVILMHDAADKILTYETLPDVIQYLRDNGYQFKTIYDIL